MYLKILCLWWYDGFAEAWDSATINVFRELFELAENYHGRDVDEDEDEDEDDDYTYCTRLLDFEILIQNKIKGRMILLESNLKYVRYDSNHTS